MSCYYGKYRGFVHSNKDPENRGRIQVLVPSIYDGAFERWALPSGMYSGAGIGSFFIPNDKDPVWVEFECGDIRFPIWSYGWLRKGDNPDGTVDLKVIQTTSGNRIELDDKNKLIRVTDPHGNIVELNSTGVSIVSSKISIGTLDGSAEKAAMGETLKAKLEELIDAILLITVQTPAGPSLPASVVNAPVFQALKVSLVEILSNKVTLDK